MKQTLDTIINLLLSAKTRIGEVVEIAERKLSEIENKNEHMKLKVRIERPIDDLPAEIGWYNCFNHNGYLLDKYYFDGKEWEDRGSDLAAWLSPPITANVLMDDELEEIKKYNHER